MRLFLIALMIALLPLRGWVGDAMAMQMALTGHHAPASETSQHADGDSEGTNSYVSTIASAAAGDCAGHTGTQSIGDEPDAAHCEACTMCQTCHTVAVLQPPSLLAAIQANPTSPPATMHAFASADRALFLKPPNH